MEVSENKLDSASEGSAMEGDDLVRSIVALSGLPDQSIRSELRDILAMNQSDSSEQKTPDLSKMSLDELRAAMLVYLESIHADMMNETVDSSSEPTDC